MIKVSQLQEWIHDKDSSLNVGIEEDTLSLIVLDVNNIPFAKLKVGETRRSTTRPLFELFWVCDWRKGKPAPISTHESYEQAYTAARHKAVQLAGVNSEVDYNDLIDMLFVITTDNGQPGVRSLATGDR